MNNRLILIFTTLAIFFSISIRAIEKNLDPYSVLERIELLNGINVYLAPSNETNLMAIRVVVNVGWEVENEKNFGVSHLLEHVLFRNKNLKDEMSYLQIIKEAGGSANGETSIRETSYYASIPSNKGNWLVETFSQMILNPNIIEEYVEKEKSTVELEIGRPSAWSLALGFSPFDYLNPRYLSKPSFWETEFNIRNEQRFTNTEEQLSNRRLKTKQVLDHYNSYYYPKNMNLYITGKYDKQKLLQLLQVKWGKFNNPSQVKMPPLKKGKNREAPYIKYNISEDNPSVAIGTKVWNFDLIDEVVISSYTEYLSHRIMKELRNRKGQTYSANAENDFREKFGVAYIQFQTPKENLIENLNIVKKHILDEAMNGKISDAEINEAKQLYLADYQLKGREADVMMSYALNYRYIQDVFGKFESPYEILKSVGPDRYRKILKKYFIKNNQYEIVYQGPIFFPFDYLLLFSLVAIIGFNWLKKKLTKEFKNDHIRWIRNIKFPPLKILEIIALILGWYTFLHLYYLFDLILVKIIFFQSNVLFSYYLEGAFHLMVLIISMQLSLSLIPRKLMIMDEYLLIKSVSFFSRRIPVNQISSIESLSLFSIIRNPIKNFKKIKYRFFYFNLKFWQKGILINLKNGKSYFFSVTNSDDAKNELYHFINQL
jgi:predicted Zn-dependent peptidase